MRILYAYLDENRQNTNKYDKNMNIYARKSEMDGVFTERNEAVK